MKKLISFIRLDFITIKPYLTLKNFLLFAAVALIMLLNSDTSTSAIGILMIYAAIYVSYPFAVGEKNNVDALYATLAIERRIVVLGRYVFGVILVACAGLIACAFSFVVFMVQGKAFAPAESLVLVVAIFFAYTIIQAMQLPIYFKLGYAKAKMLAYLPLIALPLLIFLFTNVIKDSVWAKPLVALLAWIALNPLIAALLGVVLWLIIVAASCRISVGHYAKRDF